MALVHLITIRHPPPKCGVQRAYLAYNDVALLTGARLIRVGFTHQLSPPTSLRFYEG
jgi:hypothetical protein